MKVLYSVNRISLPLDLSGVGGEKGMITSLSELAPFADFQEGKWVSLATTEEGKDTIELADGTKPAFCLLHDVPSYFMKNAGALASGLVGAIYGKTVIITDKFDSTITSETPVNTKLYVTNGLLTVTEPEAESGATSAPEAVAFFVKWTEDGQAMVATL